MRLRVRWLSVGGLLGFGPEGTWPDGWREITLILGVSLVHECVHVHLCMCVNVFVYMCVYVYACECACISLENPECVHVCCLTCCGMR